MVSVPDIVHTKGVLLTSFIFPESNIESRNIILTFWSVLIQSSSVNIQMKAIQQ